MRMLRDPLQRGSDSGRLGGPYEKHCIDAVQAFIKSLGKSEISVYDLDVWRQTSRVRFVGERTDSRSRVRQLKKNLAPDVTCGSDDKDSVHGQSYRFRPKAPRAV